MNCEQAQELVTALVDRELLDADRGSLESHLKDCADCRLALEQEQLLKETLRRRAQSVRAPAELRARILADLDVSPKTSRNRWWNTLGQGMPFFRPALAAGLLLAIALPAFFLLKPASEPLAVAALQTYGRFVSGELPAHRAENGSEIVAQLTRAVGGNFHPMGYDLSAMGLEPVAGSVREIQGRKVLVVIYQGQGGNLLCYTFLGSEADVPFHAARFFDAVKKIDFYAFSRDGVNAVFHREGGVICILATERPMEELLAVAKSKAKTT